MAVSPAIAQIIPDTSLPNNAIVVPDVNSFTINGGTTAGTNLFHSFSEFSVPTGTEAFFNNAVDIDNIITRVTGGNISNIDGILSANGTANLFLLNPNGFVFGENASLNIGGSLIVSTADSLEFADGFEFSTIVPETSPLLTVSVPIGLQLGTDPGAIVVRGIGNNLTAGVGSNRIDRESRPVGLQVNSDRALIFASGGIDLIGGNLTAPGGAIDIVSAAGKNRIELVSTDTTWQTNVDGIANFENITLSQASSLDTSGESGGVIRLRSGNLSLADGSAILAETLGSADGIGIDIRSTETVDLNGTSPLNLLSLIRTGNAPEAAGNSGDVTIETSTLTLRDGTFIAAFSDGLGDGGNISIRASDRIEMSGIDSEGFGSAISAGVPLGGRGNGADIMIYTPLFSLQDGAFITASTQGEGDSGNIAIRANDRIEMSGFNGIGFGNIISAEVLGNGTGNAGNINIETRELMVDDGGQITASTFGNGNSGNISIVATESIALRGLDPQGFGATIAAQVNPEAIGNSGGITLETGQLTLENGSLISTTTFSQGSAGKIDIRATEAIDLSGFSLIDNNRPSSIVSQVDFDGIGNAGDIQIETTNLLLDDGTFISSRTFGNGDGGNISIVASESIALQGFALDSGPSQIDTAVSVSSAVGNAGDIAIETGQLLLDNAAIIQSTLEGEGNAGNITIVAGNSITFRGSRGDGVIGSVLQTRVSSRGTGNAGTVRLETGRLSIQDRGSINSESRGMGNAGEVTILARESIDLDNGGIITQMSESGRGRAVGNAGIIRIETGELRLNNDSVILSQTGGINDNVARGNANDVLINADRVSVSESEISAVSEGGGNAGSAIIVADQLMIEDEGMIRVSAMGDVLAGNVIVTAEDIFLGDRALIEANIESGGGGNIQLDSNTLILRRNGNINTNATGEATGGSITLNAEVIAALENSDITANSQQDAGGNVIINTQGIFGTEFREFQTPQSDITATGATQELQGTVQINTPDVASTSGIVDLPTNPIDAASLIGQDPCSQGQGSEFVITGRGGLPPSPFDPLGGNATIAIDWVEFPPSSMDRGEMERESSPLPITHDLLPREATSWTIAPDGTIFLYAIEPANLTVTGDRCQLKEQ